MQQLLAIKRFLFVTLLLTTTSIGLMGCGNKGPLYLPPEVVQEVSAPAETATETVPDNTDANESEASETTETE